MARVWLVRSSRALSELLENRVVRGHSKYVDEDFLFAYKWMRAQMRKRVGPGPKKGYPIWTWYQYSDAVHRKPDLRHTSHLPRGTQGVRIELEVPEEQLLLSDFDLWHYTLNNWYLPCSEADGERFEQWLTDSKPPKAARRKEKEKSWKRVFDLEFSAPDIADERSKKSIQACVWEVTLDQVINVDTFTAR